MNRGSYFKIIVFISSLHIGICASQEQTEADAIIQQAADLVVADQAEEGARILLEAYDEASSIEDSTRFLNLALKYYYDLGNHETVRELSQEAINKITPEDEKYFQAHSQTYGFLAKYLIEIENDYETALPLLAVCEKGADSRIEEWCEEEIDRIKADRKDAVLSELNSRLLENTLSLWLAIVGTFAGIAAFAWRLFRGQPA